jgi:ParB family chromosome partitioning protein
MTITTITKKKKGLNLSKLSSVAQIAVNPTQAPDAKVAIEKIYTLPQVRKTFGDITELQASIKEHGIIEPLVLHAEDDGRYRLIIGERRLRCAKALVFTEVPAIIKRGLDEKQIRALQVTENIDREDLTAYDEAMGVIDDVTLYGTKEAMVIWNRGEAWISKRMAVKRYAKPVKSLLEAELCGDFEVLHCLNQINKTDKEEFERLYNLYEGGGTISRDEARTTLTRVKAWKKQIAEQEKHRKEQEAQQQGTEEDVGVNPNSQIVGNSLSSVVTPSPEEQAAQARERAERTLTSLREEIFEWGEANQAQFASLRERMATLEMDLHDSEWILWSGFLSMVLPLFAGLGDGRDQTYLKKLQVALKKSSALDMWEEMHPIGESELRQALPARPDNWRL